jgi:hypothetical protein
LMSRSASVVSCAVRALPADELRSGEAMLSSKMGGGRGFDDVALPLSLRRRRPAFGEERSRMGRSLGSVGASAMMMSPYTDLTRP